MTFHKALCCVGLLLPISAASVCGRGSQNSSDTGVIRTEEARASDDTLYYLDIKKPSIQLAIDPGKASQAGYKFVEIEVAEVTNPKKHLLTFEVRYVSRSNEKFLLGAFSLYPSDNPGKFIVPTQGKLKEEGTIILSLVTPDKIDSRDTIRVAVKRMKLVNG